MVNLIASALKDQVLTKNIAERAAGLVLPVTFTQEGGEVLTVPVAHDMDGAECWETGKYKDLLPNDLYKTVTYWEQRSDVGLVDNGFMDAKREFRHQTVDLRLVCWVNLQKLGYTDPLITDRIAHTLLEAVWNTDGRYYLDETDYKIRFQIWHSATVSHNADIFNPYTVDISNLLYPFDFFAIDFTVNFWYKISCITEVEAGTPNDCVTY